MGLRIVIVTAAVCVAAFSAAPVEAKQDTGHPICGPEAVELEIEKPYTRSYQAAPAVGVGPKEGDKREVFLRFTSAKATAGFVAGKTATTFTVRATAAAEGTEGTLDVIYSVQPQKAVKQGKKVKRVVWENDGAPASRECSVAVFVKLRPLQSIVVLVEGYAVWKLPGKAVGLAITPEDGEHARVTLVEGGASLLVEGKKAGASKHTLKYRIGTREFKLPVPVQVLGRDGAGLVRHSVAVFVDETKTVAAAGDLKLKDGAFVPKQLSGSYADVRAADQSITVVGRMAGGPEQFVLAYQLETIEKGKRTVAALIIELEVTVVAQPTKEHDR